MNSSATTGELLEALEAAPLLGDGLARASSLRKALTRRLTSQPDPAMQLRAQLRFGELLLALEATEASVFLLELARQADGRDDPVVAAKARLLAARACCRAGDKPQAQALVDRCSAPLDEHPELRLDHLLARAWLGPMDAAVLLLEVIQDLPASRDHDRLAALLELADRCELGGDPYRARQALEQALALAQSHHADGQAARAALLLGSLQLRTGELEAADSSLRTALALADRADEGLVRASAGLLVVSLQLHRGDWEHLLATSAPLQQLAQQRHNPAMMASLALDRSTALWSLDRPVDSLVELMTCSALLGTDPQPLELIRARFAELLERVGVERFGLLVTQAGAQLRRA